MVTEKIEKEDNIVRSESLTIPLFNKKTDEIEFTINSSDPENVDLTLGKVSGGCDMVNFFDGLAAVFVPVGAESVWH